MTITITDPEDQQKAQQAQEVNDHQTVRRIACKYTNDTQFHHFVTALEQLDKVTLTFHQQDTRQRYLFILSHKYSIHIPINS